MKNFGLVPQSALDRPIENGSQFDKYFGETNGERIRVDNVSISRETVFLILDVIKNTKNQTVKIAQYLKGANDKETCRNIWNFCFKYIKYQQDMGEEIRTPNAVWRDGNVNARQFPKLIRKDGVQYGVDCDCYTVFIGSILSNLGIHFNVKMTSCKNSLSFSKLMICFFKFSFSFCKISTSFIITLPLFIILIVLVSDSVLSSKK